MIPLVIGISTEPSLLHVGCRPSLHVGLLQRLYLTLSQNGLPNTYIWSFRNQSYNHIKKEVPNTHIWPCGNTSHKPVRKAQHSHPSTNDWKCLALTLGRARNQSSVPKGSALTSDNQCHKGSALTFNHARNQSSMPKGICTYIWQPILERLSTYIRSCKEPILHAERDLYLHLTTNIRKAQHLYSTMQGTNPSCQKGSALTSNNQCHKGLHSHLIM